MVESVVSCVSVRTDRKTQNNFTDEFYAKIPSEMTVINKFNVIPCVLLESGYIFFILRKNIQRQVRWLERSLLI